MTTKKKTISVRVEGSAKRRIEQAARLSRQSLGSFLSKVGDEHARKLLLDWAVMRRRQDETTFSELAEQTGLAVEEIMDAMGREGRDDALDAFLASCRTIAEMHHDPEFFRLAKEAVEAVRKEQAAA